MYSSIDRLIEHSSHIYKSLPAFSLKTGFRTHVYTYEEIYFYVRCFPQFFHANGIKKGDRIIVLSYNRPEYAGLILGALWSGVIVVPIDYRTNEETVHKFIAKTKPHAIFTSHIFETIFKHAKIKVFFFENLFKELKKFEVSKAEKVEDDDTAAILFTSGTTGEPKGTIISYKNILASINNVREGFPLPSKLRVLSVLPLSHALEMFGGMMAVFSFGGHIHYIERINSITILQALRNYHIQVMAVVPQMLRMILQNIERRVEEEKKEKEWEKAHILARKLPWPLRKLLFRSVHKALGGSFQFFVCGSAPLETKIQLMWEEMGIHIYQGYGASETTGFVAANNFLNFKIDTVGKLFSRIKTRIDENGNLWVKGDNIVSGYFENREQTDDVFKDGWFNTGDIVSIDSGGYFKIIGRDKFKIILPDGKKVYPEDVEKKLNNHPYVIDSAVFGIETDDGEMVHAELILKNTKKIKPVIDEVNKTLNPHEQILDYSVYPEKDFPRTKTLKIDREIIRQTVVDRTTHKIVEKKDESQNEDAFSKILIKISGKENITLHGNSILATDLKLDSLKRIEMLACIEEELGVSVPEVAITAQTSISDLRKLLKEGKPVLTSDGDGLSDWQFSGWMNAVRVILQDLIGAPLFNVIAKITVVHPENIGRIKTPQLFVFNHVGNYDVFQDLRILPAEIRKKTTIAATLELWKEAKYKSWFMMIFGNCFPFIRAEEGNNAMRVNFERVGHLLDEGFNIFISPEANITQTGQLLPFHTGVGYIAIEMEVPITLFKLNGYFEIWPEDKSRKLNLFWPKKFGKVDIIVSEPITFAKGTSYEEAAQILHEKMLALQ